MARQCSPDCPFRKKGTAILRGSGNRDHPPIAFVGEAPGETEIDEGRCFSPNGKSGSLLRALIADLGADPDDMYYTNVVMCNCRGKPDAKRINACYTGLMDELEEVQPRLVIPMGNVAAKTVGGYEKGISTVRAEYRELETSDGGRIGIFPTYHPAAILRTPDLFRDLANDLEKAIRIAVKGEPAIIPPPYDDYDLVFTQDELDAVWPKLEAAEWISLDLETESRDIFEGAILLFGIGYGRGKAASIDYKLFENRANRKRLKRLVRKKKCTLQSGGYDLAWMWVRKIRPKYEFDTEIAHWLLDEREVGHGLEAQAMQMYNAPPYKSMFRRRWGLGAYIADEDTFASKMTKIPLRAMMRYNAADADYTWRLTMDYRKELKKQGIPKRLMRLILDATELYTDLFVEGINIDMDNLDALEKKLQGEVDHALKRLKEYAPDVNPDSPKQLESYLYDVLGLTAFNTPAIKGKEIPQDVLSAALLEAGSEDPDAELYWKTSRPVLFGGTGQIEKGKGLSARSTGTFTLYWLKRQHPYPGYLIAYKHAKKRLRTYVGGVKKYIWPDGKIRPDYRLVGNLHGRFRSSRPTIHNLPNEQEIYNIYCAPPGYYIIHADYKQADLRMLAHLSGDKALINWLKGDPHSEVVKVIRRLTDEQLAQMKKDNPDEFSRSRLAAKAVNFGLLYGRGADSLAPQLGISVKEAREYIKRYWERLPDAKAWIDSRLEELLENGQEYQSPFGNKRRFPLLVSRAHRSKVASLGVNFPIMSSVNYLTAKAHVEVIRALREEGIDAKVYPHIHDSINVAVPKKYRDEAFRIMKEAMAQIPIDYGFDGVEWKVSMHYGTHWGALEEVEVV